MISMNKEIQDLKSNSREALGYRGELGYQELECPGYREGPEALGYHELGY